MREWGKLPTYPSTSLASDSPAFFPIMLVGNNSDQFAEREVSTQEGYLQVQAMGCEFVEVSTRDWINVDKAFF